MISCFVSLDPEFAPVSVVVPVSVLPLLQPATSTADSVQMDKKLVILLDFTWLPPVVNANSTLLIL